LLTGSENEESLIVESRNKRAFRDLFAGWFDVFFTNIFIFLIIGSILYIIYAFITGSSAIDIIQLVINSASETDQFNAVLVLFSVLISGGTAAGIWSYQEIIERWAGAQIVKEICRSLAKIHGTFRLDSNDYLPVSISPPIESLVVDNLKMASMLAHNNRFLLSHLSNLISLYNAEGEIIIREKLFPEILTISIVIVRQLERGNNTEFNEIVRHLFCTGAEGIRYLNPYYRIVKD